MFRSSRLLLIAALLAFPGFAAASDTPDPSSVTVAGSLQSELGCSEDWQPACAATHLAFDADDGVWQGTFNVPAGSWEYKAPLNDGWDENYGLHAVLNGGNIPLSLSAATSVQFYYSHETHWITDSIGSEGSIIVTAPGSFQSELGCPGDWQPDCLRSWLQDPDGDGIYSFSTSSIPAGTYEVKAAIGESWDENYGAGGAPNGPNISFTVAADCAETVFTYDSASHVLTIGTGSGPAQPASVTIPGSFQQEAGCSGDWQADCATTHLALEDGVWQGTFNIPAGSWEYKAAINDAWDENYGANATPNGPNLSLSLPEAGAVKFYYSHATHWVADNKSKVIATAPGSFQSELGCPGDWQPDCLLSWLQDPDGDGIYTFSTRSIPPGSYEVKVAINESWDENYGAGGAPNGANISFSVPNACAETFFAYDAATHVLTVNATGAPKGNINRAQAYWVTEDTIAWEPGAAQDVALHYDAEGDLVLGTEGVTGGIDIPLTRDPAGLPAGVREKFPHIADHDAFKIPADRLDEVPEALRGQLAVSASNDTLLDATGLQIQGVLDDLYTYEGPLGVTVQGGVTTLRVWAPTARSVKAVVFPDVEQAMTLDPATGVWSATGSWYGREYLYEVQVFVRSTGQVETNRVTDPYSVALTRNSARSLIVDLNDPALKPAGWDSLPKPPLAAFEDIVLYELHLRDFSASDPIVPQAWKGTYKAFTLKGSSGMLHLAALANAGLTHIHLLPVFDITSIDEDKSTWLSPAGDLSSFPPDSEEQQERVMAVADRDGFNWGYDPWHFTVPEGSYSTDPNGTTRNREFREMVQSLSSIGLRVVMDVVYNHTSAAGQNDRSVLDRIVPGYYHRLNADGNIETSSCCQNTASEFNMMEKLLVDSAVTWAKQYKVDGFRFDLMGHHMKRNILKLRAALDALTPAADGVDGKKVYIYGEGWNFGEVANNARGVQATQANMAGTGIGTFNDRLRDGARGGGPFSGIQEQGFLTGLYDDPNATNQGTPAEQLARLLQQTDWVRVGMAGGIADYELEDRNGNVVAAEEIDYNGQPTGYTADPQELINYIEAHDNDTLFDAIHLKASPSATMADRVRMQNLGMSLLGFAQGIPFYHAGVDLLRSKSLDRNSYNSGDWFNKLDFNYNDNNWGKGLPPAADNQANWPIMAPLLADPDLDPSPLEIHKAVFHFREVLKIRKSSRLFRLRMGKGIRERVQFHNTGPDQIPGLIAMTVSDTAGEVDHQVRRVLVVLNASKEAREVAIPCAAFVLHPVQAASADPVVRGSSYNMGTCTASVPGRTASVFWERRPVDDQLGLLIGEVADLVTAGVLNHGQGRSLIAKLENAQRQLQSGKPGPARNMIQAFINEVKAMAASGKLTAGQAAALIHDAEAAIADLG